MLLNFQYLKIIKTTLLFLRWKWKTKISVVSIRVQSFNTLLKTDDLHRDIKLILYLAGALMEDFLKGSAPLRLW